MSGAAVKAAARRNPACREAIVVLDAPGKPLEIYAVTAWSMKARMYL